MPKPTFNSLTRMHRLVSFLCLAAAAPWVRAHYTFPALLVGGQVDGGLGGRAQVQELGR